MLPRGNMPQLCRLDVGEGDAKENINSTASNVRLKTHEDIALQQPSEGRSGLYKPLFWVDLEMTGEWSITAAPQEMPKNHNCKACLMKAWAVDVADCRLILSVMHRRVLLCWASAIMYGAIGGMTSADLARYAEVLQSFTGLDLEHDTIIEIACLITDGNLEKTLEVSSSAAFCLSAQLQLRGLHVTGAAACPAGKQDGQDRQQ